MGVFICTTAMEDQDFFSTRFGFKASSCREFMLSFYFFVHNHKVHWRKILKPICSSALWDFEKNIASMTIGGIFS